MNRSLKISHVDTYYLASLEHINEYLHINENYDKCKVCDVVLLPSMTQSDRVHMYCTSAWDKMDANEKRLVNMQHPNNMPDKNSEYYDAKLLNEVFEAKMKTLYSPPY